MRRSLALILALAALLPTTALANPGPSKDDPFLGRHQAPLPVPPLIEDKNLVPTGYQKGETPGQYLGRRNWEAYYQPGQFRYGWTEGDGITPLTLQDLQTDATTALTKVAPYCLETPLYLAASIEAAHQVGMQRNVDISYSVLEGVMVLEAPLLTTLGNGAYTPTCYDLVSMTLGTILEKNGAL